MRYIVDATISVLKDWLSLFLLGMGITLAPYEYIGGMFLALAGAAISRAWEKDQNRRRGITVEREGNFQFILVVLTAFFVATLAASVVRTHFPSWNVQLIMALSGFASRRIVLFGMIFVDNIYNRSDKLADKIINKVFPDEEGKK